MKRAGWILGLVLWAAVVSGFSQCTSNCGIDALTGPNKPNTITSFTGASDSTNTDWVNFTWTTADASDSTITYIDTLGNSARSWYDATMVTNHAMTIHGAPTPPANCLASGTCPIYYATSCNHVSDGTFTSGGVTQTSGQMCPWASPDISSSGIRNPVPLKISSNTVGSGVLSVWNYSAQFPANVFQGQQVIFPMSFTVSQGSFVSQTVHLAITSVSYTDPSSTVHNCNSGTGGVYPGSSTTNKSCNGTAAPGIPANDIMIIPISGGSPTYVPTSPATNYFSTHYDPSVGGFYEYGWNGSGFYMYLAFGASLATGNYTINYTLTPVGPGITGATKAVSFTVAVNANPNTTPAAQLPTTAPSSFTVPFKGTQLAMNAYWGTWNCSNDQDITFSSFGPLARYTNSGLAGNALWNNNNVSDLSNYDMARFNLNMSDVLFASTHSAWAASTSYSIGDIITQSSGQSFMLTAVNGQASIGLSGNSGTSTPSFPTVRPSFSSTAPNFITDSGGTGGPLQWMPVGDPYYWAACTEENNTWYTMNALLNQATQAGEPNQWSPGMAMAAQRTGDAIPGDYTGYSYTEAGLRVSGLGTYANTQGSEQCSGLSETGSGTILIGAGKLATCYMDTSMARFVAATPVSSDINQGRVKALTLEDMVADWMLSNNAAWLTTTPGIRLLLTVDTALGYLDDYENVTPLTYPTLAAPMYMPSQVARALLHFYQATKWYSNSTNYPGTTVTPDERIPVALKTYADKTWVAFFDRVYDKQQTATDACYGLYPPGCTGTACICKNAASGPRHSYIIPYNQFELSDLQNVHDFYTGAASNSELSIIYAWLYARCSTSCSIPSNGRDTATTYGDAAQIMLEYAMVGYGSIRQSGTAGPLMNAWSVQDYYDGGGKTGTNYGFAGQVGGYKTFGQATVDSLESLKYLTGQWTWQEGTMIPSDNPCWVVANRTGFDNHCNAPSPFPESAIPAPISGYIISNSLAVSTPVLCAPGKGTSTTWCGWQPAGVYTSVGNQAFYLSNTGLSPSSAIVTFSTVKKPSSCSITYGTGATGWGGSGNTPPPGSTTVSETFTPVLLTATSGLTQLPLYYHQVQLNGLAANTTYHFSGSCVDTSGNVWRSSYAWGDVGPNGGLTAQGHSSTEGAYTFTTTTPIYYFPIHD